MSRRERLAYGFVVCALLMEVSGFITILKVQEQWVSEIGHWVYAAGLIPALIGLVLFLIPSKSR